MSNGTKPRETSRAEYRLCWERDAVTDAKEYRKSSRDECVQRRGKRNLDRTARWIGAREITVGDEPRRVGGQECVQLRESAKEGGEPDEDRESDQPAERARPAAERSIKPRQ